MQQRDSFYRKILTSAVFHYGLLACMLFLASYAYTVFGETSVQKMAVVVLGAFGYVLWGIFHHFMYERLYAELIAEYVLIALFSVALFAFTLFLS